MLSDPDPTFHFDADPYPDPYPTTKVLHVNGNQNYFFTFIHRASLQFYLSLQRQRGHNFQYFGQFIEIFWKKYYLALHSVEMFTDTDPLK